MGVMNTDYDFLKHFSEYVIKIIEADASNKTEPFKIINLLYSKGSLFERNAIENEFFFSLAFNENSLTLKENLSFMPETLRAVYLKTIIEN